MGKKTKTGKSRKDKYYELAKESGYRSRAAFKLLQINRKFEFLQSATILIDLCAAPGSWLQVAKQLMPPQHKIIGVDLAPIAAIPTVETFQADITTPACRQTLKDMLGHAKANVVLHDGAPNVGTAWSLDEFQQAHLCLQAFELATEFLVKGGTFVTKVFRSRDYEPLKWVLDQFFPSVKVMKPEASRLESAEIYLICQRYRAPDVIDPKFFDQRHVFKDVEGGGNGSNETSNNTLINLWHPEKKRRKRDGYDDGDTLYFEVKASEFFESSEFLSLLARANKIVIDKAEFLNHPATTDELKLCLQDVKVLGKAELKKILKWRKTLSNSKEESAAPAEAATQEGPKPPQKTSEMIAEEELSRLQEEEAKTMKKKLKKERAQRKKVQTRMNLKMIHPGDSIEQVDDIELFSLARLTRQQQPVDSLAEVDMDSLEPVRNSIHAAEAAQQAYEAAAARLDKVEASCDLEDLAEGPEIRFDKSKAGDMPHKWEAFKLAPVDRELESDTLAMEKGDDDDDDETDCAAPPKKEYRPLTTVERALAVKLIQSRKARRDLEDESYNRYQFSYDVKEDAPAFLIDDERKHARKQPPVTKAEVDTQRPKDVNVRTSKKVEQAKMRKRRRMLKKQKRITAKLEGLPDDLTDRERVMKIREVYKKASLRTKRKPVNLVVNNRGGGRPAGTVQKGGKTKVVDRRMKADLRGVRKNKNKRGKSRGNK